jgi:AcrR family transcriptional regulator
VARVRTEEKRCEIIRLAAELFEQHGYDRCSMAALSDRLGGSKATLYGYFPSKEELLRAVLDFQVMTEADRVMRDFPFSNDLRKSLIKLGTAYLNKRMSPLPVTNIRMVANQPAGSTMGKDFYESIIRPAFERLAHKFEKLMDEGKLKRADPWTALMHWKGLIDWDFFERRLLGAIDGPDPREIEIAVSSGADAFLQLYGVDQKTGTKKRSAKREFRAPQGKE